MDEEDRRNHDEGALVPTEKGHNGSSAAFVALHDVARHLGFVDEYGNANADQYLTALRELGAQILDADAVQNWKETR